MRRILAPFITLGYNDTASKNAETLLKIYCRDKKAMLKYRITF
jgi:hypothetical protein